jgi:hypothetical protein
MRALIFQHPMLFVVVVCGSAFIVSLATVILCYRGKPKND